MRRTIAKRARPGVELLADSPIVQDHDDLEILNEVRMSAVTATVSWWLRHPERTAEEGSPRSARVLAVVTGASSDEAPKCAPTR